MIPSPRLALAALAIATTLATFTHHPYLLARMIATLDQVSGGRAAWNMVTGSSDKTARVWDTGAGVYMENIYTESVPANGQPLPQQAIPLARTYGPSQPNRVDDFFDDTRLGHT